MRSARLLAAVVLLAAFAVVGLPADEPKARPPADKLPKHWDQLGLTDAQKADLKKITADHRQRREKLEEELRKVDEEAARKRVAVLTDEQKKKLIDLVADDGKAKGPAEKR
jgi:Spy/CpxP family protein refolding chaperone